MQRRKTSKTPTAPPGGWHIVRWKPAKKSDGEVGYVLSSGGARIVASLVNSNAKAPSGGTFHPQPWLVELRIPCPAGRKPLRKFDSEVEARAWVEAQLQAFLIDIGLHPAKQRHPAWLPHRSQQSPVTSAKHQAKLWAAQ